MGEAGTDLHWAAHAGSRTRENLVALVPAGHRVPMRVVPVRRLRLVLRVEALDPVPMTWDRRRHE